MLLLRDFNRGYRHPFLFGIDYLGGVGGIAFSQHPHHSLIHWPDR